MQPAAPQTPPVRSCILKSSDGTVSWPTQMPLPGAPLPWHAVEQENLNIQRQRVRVIMQADIMTAAVHQIADGITVAADSVQHALDAAVAAEHDLIKSTARLAEAEVDFKRAVDRMQETKQQGDNDSDGRIRLDKAEMQYSIRVAIPHQPINGRRPVSDNLFDRLLARSLHRVAKCCR
jgi:hypothetical protein